MIDTDGYVSGFRGSQPPSVTLVACGDVALVYGVESKILDEGPDSLWRSGRSLFKDADIAVANLECPISAAGQPYKKYPPNFRADPKTVSFLTGSGINCVNLANNHVLDYGPQALLETVDLLREHSVQSFGAGSNGLEAAAPLIMEREGIRIGFVGFTEWGPFNKNGSPGPACYSEKVVIEQIGKIRHLVDFVVLSIHFGFEFVDYPPPHHVASCRRIVEHGADIVLGHHPHQAQGVEAHHAGVIAYSLGNFLFDMGVSAPDITREALVLRLGLVKSRIVSAQVVPYRMRKDLAIEVLVDDEREQALKRYQILSDALANPRAIGEGWYKTIRSYMITYAKSLWHNTVRLRKPFFPLLFARLFFGSKPNRHLLRGFIKYLVNGYSFRKEFGKLIRKLGDRGLLDGYRARS